MATALRESDNPDIRWIEWVAAGHAAGVAGSLAVKHGIPPREVNAPELQDRLRADGVDLGR